MILACCRSLLEHSMASVEVRVMCDWLVTAVVVVVVVCREGREEGAVVDPVTGGVCDCWDMLVLELLCTIPLELE